MKVCKEDPSIFAAPLTWQQPKVELTRLLKQCECCFNDWKISGNHGEFNDNNNNNNTEAKTLPFANFAGNSQSIKCLHKFVQQFPNVFEKAIGHLPKGAFQESICDKGAGSSSTPCASARKKRLQSIKQDNLCMLQKHLNMEKREEALSNQNAANLDCRLMMHRDALDKAEDRRMELIREARKQNKLSHGAVNARHQKHLDETEMAFQTGVYPPQPKTGDDNNEDAESVDSLVSIFCQIHRQDENTAKSERRLIKAGKDANSLKQTIDI